MFLSVVILTYNSMRTIAQCLDAVELTTQALSDQGKECEVFIVDNGSTDGTAELIKEAALKKNSLYRPLFLAENHGTTVSRNKALRQSSGDYVLVLDSDAYIHEEAVNYLSNYLKSNPHVGLVSPQLNYADGRFQISVDQFPTVTHKIKRFLFLAKMQEKTAKKPVTTGPVDYAISACWLISRQALHQCPHLDESIFYAPEDVEYCMQLWSHGLEVHYAPSVKVIHDAQELSRGFRIGFFHWSHLKGLLYLFRKYNYAFSRDGLHRRFAEQRRGV